MASSTSPRVFARRVLGRDRLEALERSQSNSRERVDRVEETVAALSATVATVGVRLDGVEAAFDRLHATVVAADPEATRAVIEAVRADVARLSVELNRQLAQLAAG